MLFLESDLVFDFEDKAWMIKKYDKHRYYKRLSGSGLKGVDFIGIFREQEVVFFEVKNFRDRHPSLIEPFAVLQKTKQFINKIGDKLEDTFKATTAIAAHLRKKWWYRLFLKWEKYLPKQLFLHQDWFFWHLVHQLSKEKKQTIFVLWLEIEERISEQGKKDLAQYIDKRLGEQLIEFTNKVIVASLERPAYPLFLKVMLQRQEGSKLS